MNRLGNLRWIPALVIVCSLAACSASSDNAGRAATTTTSPNDDARAVRQDILDGWAEDGSGGVTVAMADRDAELQVLAAGTTGPGGGPMTADSEFRVGSLSKTFVAVMVLQVVAEDVAGLDDLVTQHVPELTIADGITIRQLLAHRSGLPDYVDEFLPAVSSDPARTWTHEDVLGVVVGQPLDFPPGEQFAYSNTNYIVAGLVLEQLTGRTVAENLESRIVEPLGLTGTYLAPDTEREPIGAYSASLPGGDTAGASYRALETGAGAAGAVVSTAGDLATFLRALAHGDLLPDETYSEMTKGLPSQGESLGVFAADPPTTTGISNLGQINGFQAFMQYDPATEDLFVLLLNDDTRSPEQLGNDLIATAAD
ncbi:serine hydrolase domain-containing protein [soil metagenome]